MFEIRDGLKYLFQTRNPITFCGTGSGNAGMEICLGNLIEPADIVLIFVSGSFGWRAVEMSKRYGADVRSVESKLGTTFKYEQIRAHIELHKPKIVFICHGDSSTGVLQSLDKVGDLCRRYNYAVEYTLNNSETKKIDVTFKFKFNAKYFLSF